jgi:hypothetical protein
METNNNYYVRMRIENYILERYGFCAEIQATKEGGLDVFYALLYTEESGCAYIRGINNEYDEWKGRFNNFNDAHDFLVEKIKEKVRPIAFDVMVRGRWAGEDLEKIEGDFKL